MKNLIIAGLFTFVFVVPENFNLQEFLVNAKDIGIIAVKKDNWPAKNVYLSQSGRSLKISMYDSKLETPELKATLQTLVDAATSPIVTVKDLIDAQWVIAKDEEKTLQERFDALLEIEKIRRGE